MEHVNFKAMFHRDTVQFMSFPVCNLKENLSIFKLAQKNAFIFETMIVYESVVSRARPARSL